MNGGPIVVGRGSRRIRVGVIMAVPMEVCMAVIMAMVVMMPVGVRGAGGERRH